VAVEAHAVAIFGVVGLAQRDVLIGL
jgi:hypothetical protein